MTSPFDRGLPAADADPGRFPDAAVDPQAGDEDRVVVVVGKGPGATAIPLEINPFTLVGATTRAGLLTGPLRDRFGFVGQMEFYEPAELERVLARSADLLGVAVGEDAPTVEEVCEPFLVRAGLLARTPRGRVATEAAFRHLGHPVPRGGLPLSGGTGDPPPGGASSQTLFDA